MGSDGQGVGIPAGVAKEDFLAGVRTALGREAGPPQDAYPRLGDGQAELEERERELYHRVAANRDGLLEGLASTAELRGWKVHRARDGEEAIGRVTAIVAAGQVKRVVRSTQEVFQQAPFHQALTDAGVQVVAVARNESQDRETLRRDIIAADVGITGADYAVAETGSVVVMPRAGLSRLVSLVPPMHIALVRPEDVVESLDDVFLLRRLEFHRKGGDMGSYLNFITGPSRTADIEQTLVVGVHGPREVHLVLLG